MSAMNVSDENFRMTQKQSILSDLTGLRIDGRKPNELRRLNCQISVADDCDGSAYLEQGLTKVLAVVHGPHEVQGDKSKQNHKNAIIKCQYSMAVFATSERRKRPHGDKKTTELSVHLEKVLASVIRVELFPWSQIDIFVDVLQADGSNFPAAINAATLALIDAGIPLKEYVSACTASITKSGVPLVDISHAEELLGCPVLTVVILPLSEKIVFTEMSQRFHISLLNDVLSEGFICCKKIRHILDATVNQYLGDTCNSIDYDKITSNVD